jgi:hypothetical protein
MQVETKYLRLFRAVELGDDIDGWRVCWLGGWDKCRVLFVVMVKRVTDMPSMKPFHESTHYAPRGCDQAGKRKNKRKAREGCDSVKDRGEEC